MMKLFRGARVPLREEEFTGAATARFYDVHAGRFMSAIYRRLAARITQENPAGKRVLDIGTGTGRLAIALAQARPDWSITGIDIAGDMLQVARESAARNSLGDRVEFKQADAAALPYGDNHFDIVTSNASLHLWADPLKAFGEIARVTAPGGVVIIWDNRRLAALAPLFRLAAGLLGMNAGQRKLWLEAMRSSYTIGEIRTMLEKSALRGARVTAAAGGIYLGIEWRKP